MTTTTQINITAKDNTAGAFSSASNNLSELASSALKTTAGLAGIGLSIAGAVDAIKGISQATIQFQKFNSTLLVGAGSAQGAADALSFVRSESQRLGLDLATAAEQFSKLTAASKGSALEGKATRDIFSSMSEAAAVLGLSADETRGALNAFQQMISKGKVQAEELRGQLGERLPGAFQLAARAMGVTTAELDKLLVAGKVTAEDLLPKLAVELNKTFGSQAEKSAQGLSGQLNRMNTAMFDLKIAIGESGLINFLSSGIELATKLANALTGAFGGGQKLSPIEKQVSLIQTLEKELESLQNLTHIPLIGDLLFDKKQADLLKFRIESATEDLGKMKASLAADASGETVISQAAKETENLTVVTKKTISDAERFLSALKKESQNAGLTAIEMKRLEAAHLGVSKTADPLISRIEQVTQEMEAQKAAASSLASDLNKIKSITESVKTEEEKLNDTQAELNRLLGSGLPIETYNRAMQKAQSETKGLEKQTISTTEEVSQLWKQAGRNIQSALANGIFNFFDDGLKGMVKNVASTVGRILSEFAALKLAQGIGLAGMFGASGAASASTGGGSLFSGAVNLGSSAVNLFSSGGGISKGISGLLGLGGSSGIFSNAGGAATAFIGGPGTALGGSGLGGFASMGSSIGAAAGPIMAAFAVDAIGRALAGDKKLGGAEYIPVLGGFLAAMFGRGPMKFRQQSLQGDVSSSGFDGDITNVFRAKGGLFVGNKHKSVTEQLSQDQQDLFDQTIKGFYTSAHGFAENLGFSTDLVDTFTKTIQIKSEKGKKLTEEAITEMIQGIGDSLAKNVIPNIDEFRKAGEKSFDTFTRLNNEFLGLTAGAQNLGLSIGYAKDLINGMSISARTEFVDSIGGLEALSTKTGFFFSNFLTQTEQFDVKSSALTDGLHKLGLSADLTVEQFKSLVQSTSTANDLRVGLLNLAPAFVEVKGAIDSLFGDTLAATQNRAAASRELEQTISNNIITGWRNLIDSVSEEIDKLKGFADSLKGTINSILPQSLDSARAEIINATSAASGGQITDVSGALSTLSNQSSSGFSNRLDFERSKAFSATLITGLSDAVLASISDKQSMISGYNSNISLVQSGKPTNQINGSSQVDVATLLQNLINQTAASGQYSKDLYNLLKNMTNNGTALNTVAA